MRHPSIVVGAMTGEVSTPTRPEIARDLIGRFESAAATWRAPACKREAAPEGVARAARHTIESDAQALRRIVARLQGWPGRTLVGDDGCQAALAIALNSDRDPAFQVTLLQMLADAVRRGDATTAQWAHLHDRCLVRSGRPQTYGTQYRWYDGQLEMCPVIDPGGLDQRRVSVGLPLRKDQLVALRSRHESVAALAVSASGRAS
ncbi:DUF6624 domain-containing protein [Streptomyces sp. NPDC058861]|uniref:DUF6624 domain-containing protein n=1 Tax=Streptomyces sp. NPDC058861 TaxID=3346653 RepID=UPI00368BC911